MKCDSPVSIAVSESSESSLGTVEGQIERSSPADFSPRVIHGPTQHGTGVSSFFNSHLRAVPNRSRKASGNRPWLEMGVRVTPISSLRVAGLPPISKSLAESQIDSARTLEIDVGRERQQFSLSPYPFELVCKPVLAR